MGLEPGFHALVGLCSVTSALSQGLPVRSIAHRIPQRGAPGRPAPLVSPGQHRAAGLLAPGCDDHPAVAVRAFRQELVFPFPAVHEGPESAVSFGQQPPGAGWA